MNVDVEKKEKIWDAAKRYRPEILINPEANRCQTAYTLSAPYQDFVWKLSLV